jgi:hypothetical protein
MGLRAGLEQRKSLVPSLGCPASALPRFPSIASTLHKAQLELPCFLKSGLSYKKLGT